MKGRNQLFGSQRSVPIVLESAIVRRICFDTDAECYFTGTNCTASMMT